MTNPWILIMAGLVVIFYPWMYLKKLSRLSLILHPPREKAGARKGMYRFT